MSTSNYNGNYNGNGMSVVIIDSGHTWVDAHSTHSYGNNFVIKDTLGYADEKDYYSFTLDNDAMVNVTLTDLDGDVDLLLVKANGFDYFGNPLATTVVYKWEWFNVDLEFSTFLNAGEEYFIVADSYDLNDTNYTLTVDLGGGIDSEVIPPTNPIDEPETPDPVIVPVTPPEEPVSPPEEPVSPPEAPVSPPEAPVTPPEEPVSPPEEPVTPPEEPVTPPEEPVAPPITVPDIQHISPEYDPGGTLEHAYQLTPTSNQLVITDTLRTTAGLGNKKWGKNKHIDDQDVFSFTLDHAAEITIDLTQLDQDVNLYLMSKANDDSPVYQHIWEYGNLDLTLTHLLDAEKEYFIKVESWDNKATDYTLSIDFNGGIDVETPETPSTPETPETPPTPETPETPTSPAGYAGLNVDNTVNYFLEHIQDYAVV